MLLVTFDDQISGADIMRFDDEAAFAAFVQDYNSRTPFDKITGLGKEVTGDCWVNLHDASSLDADLERLAASIGVSVDDLSVRCPGEHPGHGYWVTPRGDVYGVRFAPEND